MATTDIPLVEMRTDLETAYMDYAVETIADRALPRVEDGLKPVQRRILYAMHDMKLKPGGPHRKSARVVGEVLGKYHPHGDQSVYLAMARMAQEFSLRDPLVDGQGNFGSIDGDSPAAMRYTEARMTALSTWMMQDLERDAVDFVDNFDGSLQEPTILPTVVPNLLVNGSSGIAVGMSTNIPSHNLGEVCDALIHMAGKWKKRDQVTVDELMEHIPGPDFPTGGVIYRRRSDRTDESEDVIRKAYETGRGRIVMQAKILVEDIGGGKSNLVVEELPYAVQKNTVIERIAREVKDGNIEGITDLRDESDFDGMRLVIEVSRSAEPKAVLEAVLSRSQLRETFGVQLLVLVPDEYGIDGVRPDYLSLRDILVRFIEHRLTVIIRRSRHELEERERRLHIVEGLLIALAAIDEVVDTIKRSRNARTASNNLRRNFKVSEEQAHAILSMPLRRLTSLEVRQLKDEADELAKRIAYLKKILRSEKERLKVIVEETQALKEAFATPRRTEILDMDADEASAVTEADLVMPEEDQYVFCTTKGVTRCDASYRDRGRTGVTSRAVETSWAMTEANPEQKVALFSAKGLVWYGVVGKIPDAASPQELGLDKDDVLVGCGTVSEKEFVLIGTKKGKIKRVTYEDLVAVVEGSWTRIVGLTKADEVLFAGMAPDEAHVFFFTERGQGIRFETSEVNPQATPTSRGVTGIKVKKGDRIISGAVFMPDDVTHVALVSEHGWTKKMKLDEFSTQGRGGQGMRTLGVTKATGVVAGACVVPKEARYLDVISSNGRRCRLPIEEVPEVARQPRGDQLVDFDDDEEKIVAVTSLVA
jgi:DNA gyrase subunit A